jgi:hypothetical protein
VKGRRWREAEAAEQRTRHTKTERLRVPAPFTCPILTRSRAERCLGLGRSGGRSGGRGRGRGRGEQRGEGRILLRHKRADGRGRQSGDEVVAAALAHSQLVTHCSDEFGRISAQRRAVLTRRHSAFDLQSTEHTHTNQQIRE